MATLAGKDLAWSQMEKHGWSKGKTMVEEVSCICLHNCEGGCFRLSDWELWPLFFQDPFGLRQFLEDYSTKF
jgi:hypothetical protein